MLSCDSIAEAACRQVVWANTVAAVIWGLARRSTGLWQPGVVWNQAHQSRLSVGRSSSQVRNACVSVIAEAACPSGLK